MPTSMRPLVNGSGTVSVTFTPATMPAPCVVTFSQSQSFKEGTMIYATGGGNWPVFVIRTGADKVWETYGPAGCVAGSAFKRSDTSTSRARGGVNAYIPGSVPVFSYLSMRDHNGNPDFYLYQDTLFPENGVHPYTRDQWTGQAWWTTDVASGSVGGASYLLDVSTRLRFHEGRLNVLDSNPALSDSLIGPPWSR